MVVHLLTYYLFIQLLALLLLLIDSYISFDLPKLSPPTIAYSDGVENKEPQPSARASHKLLVLTVATGIYLMFHAVYI